MHKRVHGLVFLFLVHVSLDVNTNKYRYTHTCTCGFGPSMYEVCVINRGPLQVQYEHRLRHRGAREHVSS